MHEGVSRKNQPCAVKCAIEREIKMKPSILLLHGLFRTEESMEKLRTAFEQQGYTVYNWGYPASAYPVPVLADQLLERVKKEITESTQLHCIGHSLGAILLRTLARHKDLPFHWGRVVMLTPPNHGSWVINYFHLDKLTRYLGPSIKDLRVGNPWLDSLPMPHTEIGIIGGTKHFCASSSISYLSSLVKMPPHDGLVTLDSMLHPAMKEFITLPVQHRVIMEDNRAIQACLRFVENGSFS
jgi:hypothetical protein